MEQPKVLPMAKLLLFPITVLMLLSIFSVVYTGETYQSSIPDEAGNNRSSWQANMESGNSAYDFWQIAGFIGILIAALAIGIAFGFKFVGSGFNDESQRMVFIAIMLMGLWAGLSLVGKDMLFNSIFTIILYVALTLMYVIGVSQQLMGDSSG